MDFNITQIFVVFGLITVIVVQAIAHYFTIETARLEREKLLAAIMAKNSDQYNDIIRTEKTPISTEPEVPDEILLSEASDELFDQVIKNQTS